MKYLKLYEGFEDEKDELPVEPKKDSFDLEFAMAKVKEHYSEDEVVELFDDEWPNWVDNDWEDDGDYDTEYDWYMDHNNNEAQDAVIHQMMNWYCKEFNGGNSLASDPHCELFDAIKDEYSCLN